MSLHGLAFRKASSFVSSVEFPVYCVIAVQLFSLIKQNLKLKNVQNLYKGRSEILWISFSAEVGRKDASSPYSC